MDDQPIPPPEAPLSTLEALARLGGAEPTLGGVVADTNITRPMPTGGFVRPYSTSDGLSPLEFQEAVARGEASSTPGTYPPVPPAALAILARHDIAKAAFAGKDLDPTADPNYRRMVTDQLVGMVAGYVLAAEKPDDAAAPPVRLEGLLTGSRAAAAAMQAGLNLTDDLSGEPP